MLDSWRFTKSEQQVIPKIRESRAWFRTAGLWALKRGAQRSAFALWVKVYRPKGTFDLHPERLIADTAYGTGPMLGWLVDRKIAPHIPVFDKSGRSDGT